jgi:hypothetical protein
MRRRSLWTDLSAPALARPLDRRAFTRGALAALGISYGLNKSGISLTLIAVGIDYAQVRWRRVVTRLKIVMQRKICIYYHRSCRYSPKQTSSGRQ